MAARDHDLLSRAAALIGKSNRVVHLDADGRSSDTARQLAELTAAVEARRAPDIDWTETLDLIERTGAALTAREERTRELEGEVRELAERTTTEIQRLQAQIAALEERLHVSERRRTHAEDWLRRIHEAIVDRFDLGPVAGAEDRTTSAAQAS